MKKSDKKIHIKWGRVPDFLAAQMRTAQLGIYDHFSQWFSESELSPKQFGVLYVISLNPGVNQRQLANVHSTERAAFGETLARLEDKGYIERRPCEQDRRAKIPFITPQGEQVLNKILEEISQQEKAFAKNLTDAERHMLLSLLLKLNTPVVKS